MGTYVGNHVFVVWEEIDEIEKQMIASLYKANKCALSISTPLSETEIKKVLDETMFIQL